VHGTRVVINVVVDVDNVVAEQLSADVVGRVLVITMPMKTRRR